MWSGRPSGGSRKKPRAFKNVCSLGVAFVGLLLVLHLLRTAQGQTAKTIYF